MWYQHSTAAPRCPMDGRGNVHILTRAWVLVLGARSPVPPRCCFWGFACHHSLAWETLKTDESDDRLTSTFPFFRSLEWLLLQRVVTAHVCIYSHDTHLSPRFHTFLIGRGPREEEVRRRTEKCTAGQHVCCTLFTHRVV